MSPSNFTSWTELGLSQEMLSLIEKANFKSPTPVQIETIPAIMQGLDVLASSQTGSGKTASFVIPTVERFKNKNGTYILALSPTREIAQQTGAVFEEFATSFGMKLAVCIGGTSLADEKEALSSSPHIIVATPGRLCDHLERGNVWLDFIQCLIFDEADRMLEMGFANQIDIITSQIPKQRQTLMFSATFSPKVEKLALKSLNKPKEVLIERTTESAPKIDQRLFWVEEDRKFGELLNILRRETGSMFVFVKAKERTYQVWRSLVNAGFEKATYIHSDLPQEARELAVADFKTGKFQVLIATDVMGRGIDVDDVAHVVNYDVPKEAADYVHRIGRTGRRGLTGKASTFAVPRKDERTISAIEVLLGKTPSRPHTSQAHRPTGPRKSSAPPSGRMAPQRTHKIDSKPTKKEELKHNTPQVNSDPQKVIKPKTGILGFFKKLFK